MSVKTTGFPSPAEEYRESVLSLDQHIVKNPSATFYMRANSNNLAPIVYKEDILVVDRALKPEHGKLIVVSLHGEFLVRRLQIQGNQKFLISEQNRTPPLDITENEEVTIFGVVSWVVHKTF